MMGQVGYRKHKEFSAHYSTIMVGLVGTERALLRVLGSAQRNRDRAKEQAQYYVLVADIERINKHLETVREAEAHVQKNRWKHAWIAVACIFPSTALSVYLTLRGLYQLLGVE